MRGSLSYRQAVMSRPDPRAPRLSRLAMPFVVTNRAGKRSRAGRALAGGPFAAACDAVGWSPTAKTFASRVNRSESGRVSREDLLSVGSGAAVGSESVCCCALRGRTAPPRFIAPETAPQSIALRRPLRLAVFAVATPLSLRTVTAARSLSLRLHPSLPVGACPKDPTRYARRL